VNGYFEAEKKLVRLFC